MNIKEIKNELAHHPADAFIASLKNDKRKGVQQALASYLKKQQRLVVKQQQFHQRFRYENQFWQNGVNYVAGIDEVGRGPLAGPVVACAIILPHNFNLVEVNDSKQLSPHMRMSLYGKILTQALTVGIGMADNKLIDKINIYQATRIAMQDAIQALTITPEQLIIDAMQIETNIPQLKLIKGDAKSISVAAASIVAKVYRDHLMRFYDQLYPGFDFAKNAGYGTSAHLNGLKKYGVTPIHRLTFAPVKNFLI